MNALTRAAVSLKEPPVVTLETGLCAEQIDARLRHAMRLADLGHRAVAFYLADLAFRGLHQQLGQPTAISYATNVLGMSKRKAQELLTAGRRLENLPQIDEAFAKAELPWSKVRRIVMVATRETEAEWLDVAMREKQDVLDEFVKNVRQDGRPPQGEALPRRKFKVVLELDQTQYETLENAREKLRAERGFPEGVRPEDLFLEMAQMILSSEPDGTVPGRKAVDGSIYKVIVNESEADEATEAAVSDGVTPDWMRKAVFNRDGYLCRNCERPRQTLNAHHVVWRSHGGPTETGNLIALCVDCHSLVHTGYLKVDRAQCAQDDPRQVRFVMRDRHGRRTDRPLFGKVATTSRAQGARHAGEPTTGT